MTKKEKEIYEFVKRHNNNGFLDPFDTSIFCYIGGAFPKATIKNVISVVNKLQDEDLELREEQLKSLTGANAETV